MKGAWTRTVFPEIVQVTVPWNWRFGTLLVFACGELRTDSERELDALDARPSG
jgi:hypothetical protein